MPIAPPPSFRSAAAAATLSAILLAGCSARTHDRDGNGSASISIGGGNASGGGVGGGKSVSIDVPGFSAKIAVPGLDLGGGATAIDGIALFPGTRIDGVDIKADGADGSGGDSQGRVAMGFTAPAAPDRVLSYYRDAAAKSGWAVQPPAAGQQFAASKTDAKSKTEHLALTIAAAATGSTGRFLIDGG